MCTLLLFCQKVKASVKIKQHTRRAAAESKKKGEKYTTDYKTTPSIKTCLPRWVFLMRSPRSVQKFQKVSIQKEFIHTVYLRLFFLIHWCCNSSVYRLTQPVYRHIGVVSCRYVPTKNTRCAPTPPPPPSAMVRGRPAMRGQLFFEIWNFALFRFISNHIVFFCLNTGILYRLVRTELLIVHSYRYIYIYILNMNSIDCTQNKNSAFDLNI